MKTGFIGLGTMGLPMAHCLERQGMDLLGWDINPVAMQNFATCVDSIAALAKICDTFITMLPEGAHVNSVYDHLLTAGIPDACLFIDCSTIDVEITRALAARVTAAGHSFSTLR